MKPYRRGQSAGWRAMPALAIVIALVGGACGAPAQSAAPGGLPTPGPSTSGNLPGPTGQPGPGGSPGGIGGRPDDGQAPIPPLPDDIVAGVDAIATAGLAGAGQSGDSGRAREHWGGHDRRPGERAAVARRHLFRVSGTTTLDDPLNSSTTTVEWKLTHDGPISLGLP